MADDLRILIRAELDEALSAQRMEAQLPSISKLIKQKIQVQAEIDEANVTKQAETATRSIASAVKSQSKVVSAAYRDMFKGVNMTDNPLNTQAVEREIRSIIATMTKAKGELSKFSILTDKNNDPTGALVTYRNELNQVITARLRLNEVEEQGQKTSQWEVVSTSFSANIRQANKEMRQFVNLQRDLQSRASILKELTPENINLDWSKFNESFENSVNLSDLKQAQFELGQVNNQYSLLNAQLRKEMPNNAIENLPRNLEHASASLRILENGFKRFGAVPQSVTDEFSKVKSLLEQSSDPSLSGDKKVQVYNQITAAVDRLRDSLRLMVSDEKAANQPIVDSKLLTNVDTLDRKIRNMPNLYSKMNGDPSAMKQYTDLMKSMDAVKASPSQAGVQKVAAEYRHLDQYLIGANEHQQNFWDTTKKNASKMGTWMVLGTVIASAMRMMRNMVTAVKELDKSLTELQKVSDLSGSALDRFTDKAYNLGATIGRTGKEVIDAVTTFKRAGYELSDSMGLAEAALVMTNVGDGIGDVEEASSSLISVLRGFNIDSSGAMGVVDAINQVSNTAPIDFENITEGLKRVSGTMSQTGTSLAETIALLTGGFATQRDIESVSSGKQTAPYVQKCA